MESLENPAAFVGRDLKVIVSNSRFAELFGKVNHDLSGIGFPDAHGVTWHVKKCRWCFGLEHRQAK